MFFLPYKIDRPFKLPVVTIVLIATNVFVCALTMFNLSAAVDIYGFRPNLSGFLTWFSSMFIHGDPIFHLGGNMYFLWLFGSVVEDAVGKARYLLLYFAGGIAAALVHALVTAAFMPEMYGVPLIGASGGLAAVIGVFAVRMYKNHMSIAYLILLKPGTFTVTSVVGVGLWFAREVLDGTLAILAGGSSVANWAHIGGLAFGAGASMIFGLAKEADVESLTEEAATYASTGVHSVAATKYSELAQSEPDNPSWYLERGYSALLAGGDAATAAAAAADIDKGVELLARSRRLPEALLAYERLAPLGDAIALAPKTLLTFGSASETNGRNDLAARAYWDLVQRYPEAHEAEKALFRLPHVYLAAGMPNEARQTWERFIAKYPASQWIDYADRGLSAAG